MFDAKLDIIERTNKNGEPYEILAIYMVGSNGSLVRVHEVYMKDTLRDIIKFVDDASRGVLPHGGQ